VPEPLHIAHAEAQRLCVQRLLEERACETGVAEALAALCAAEDRLQRLRRALTEPVLRVCREAAEDRDELVGRVVGEVDLALEARAKARVRL